MKELIYILILSLGSAAYISAVYQMLRGEYSPSFFSRGVWFLLGVNSFAGVFLGNGSMSSIILAGTLFVGNAAVFAVSYKKGSRDFHFAEKSSLVLLIFSTFVWAVLDAPFAALAMSLCAHFIGGIPTIWRAIKKASNEQAYHWYFFFLASILAFISSPEKTITAILFPAYFTVFQGFMLILINRKRLFGLK